MNWACTKEGYGYLGEIVLRGSGRKKRGSRGADNGCCILYNWIYFTWQLRKQAAYKQATRGLTDLSTFRRTRQWGLSALPKGTTAAASRFEQGTSRLRIRGLISTSHNSSVDKTTGRIWRQLGSRGRMLEMKGGGGGERCDPLSRPF